MDYLTIAGANIKALTNAFRIEYMIEQNGRPETIRPMDVVVVAGYDDLVDGHARDYIVEKLHIFADLVMHRTREEKLDRHRGNTIAISSLMYPPQLAWFPDNGPEPYEGYTNNRAKIDWLNGEISDLNLAYNSLNPPRFHTYGLRSYTRKNVDIYGQVTFTPIKSHRWEHWRREDNPAEMLHLTNERRFKMATAINNYFKFNTA